MATQEFIVQNAFDWIPARIGSTNAPSRIEVGFIDQTSTPSALSTPPQLVIVRSQTGLQMASATMTPVIGMTGRYYHELFLNDWEEGLYQFRASGTLPAAGPAVSVEGAFMVNAPTPDETLIHWVRSRLKDLDPELYKLDLPIPKWNPSEIARELFNGLLSLNNAGPIQTTYTLADCPRSDLLIDYAWARALQSAAVLENWNSFTMSDGSANLTINRVQALTQMADQALTRFKQDLADWKRSLRPRLIGQGTALFPFSIRRAIGFLPNMKQIFG